MSDQSEANVSVMSQDGTVTQYRPGDEVHTATAWKPKACGYYCMPEDSDDEIWFSVPCSHTDGAHYSLDGEAVVCAACTVSEAKAEEIRSQWEELHCPTSHGGLVFLGGAFGFGLAGLIVVIVVLLSGCSRRTETATPQATSTSQEAAWPVSTPTTSSASATSDQQSAKPTSKSPSGAANATASGSGTRTPAPSGPTDGGGLSVSSVISGLRSSVTRTDTAQPLRVAETRSVSFAQATTSASIPRVERCLEQRAGRDAPPPCTPPATLQLPTAPVPFDAPTRFGYPSRRGNEATHVWLKAGEPSRPCTPAEAKNGSAYRVACAAKIGDPFYELGQVRAVAPVSTQGLFAESAAAPAASSDAVVRRVDNLDVYVAKSGERYCRVGTTNAACAGIRRRYWLVAAQIADVVRARGLCVDAARLKCACISRGGYKPDTYGLGSWMVIPVEDDSIGDQYVELRYGWCAQRKTTFGAADDTRDPLVPQVRIRDLVSISASELN